MHGYGHGSATGAISEKLPKLAPKLRLNFA